MKIKKMNFDAIKNALSRNEMREIMAGSGSNRCYVQCRNVTGLTGTFSCLQAEVDKACALAGSDGIDARCFCN